MITLTDSFYFQYKITGCPWFLEPGGHVSTSEGKGDLGAAQAGCPRGLNQYWKQIGRRALGTK